MQIHYDNFPAMKGTVSCMYIKTLVQNTVKVVLLLAIFIAKSAVRACSVVRQAITRAQFQLPTYPSISLEGN
jgi:hypothetical protein